MRTLELFIPGRPRSKGSMIPFTRKDGKASMRHHDGKELVEWSNLIRTAASAKMNGRPPTAGAVVIRAAFFFTRPKAHYGTGRNAYVLKQRTPSAMLTKPDLDKLARAAMDALTGVAFRDDSQIVNMSLEKLYRSIAKSIVIVHLMDEPADE